MKPIELELNGARFRGKSALGERDPGALLSALRGLEPYRFLRRVPKRETFVVDLSDLEAPLAVDGTAPEEIASIATANPQKRLAVMKRCQGGEPRDSWFEVLHGGPERSPARREAENLLGMASDGLPVPRPLAYWEQVPRGLGLPGKRFGQSILLMEYVPHTETLRDVLWSGDPRGRPLLQELATLVGTMHGAGWYHRDLYMEHVVLGPDGLALLDVGRARCQRFPLHRWFAKDLAAIWTSRQPGSSTRAHFDFLLRWAQVFGERSRGLPLSKLELQDFLPEIEKRGKRLLAHKPKHVHQDPGAT